AIDRSDRDEFSFIEAQLSCPTARTHDPQPPYVVDATGEVRNLNDHSVILGERVLRNRDLGHLERDSARVGDDLRADLDQLFLERRQRSALDRFGRGQREQKTIEVAGERVKLEANGVGGEGAARRSRARRRARPDCGIFLGRNERYYRLTNAVLSDIIACENDHPDAGRRQRSRRPSPRRSRASGGRASPLRHDGPRRREGPSGPRWLPTPHWRLRGDLRRGCKHDSGDPYRPPGHDDYQEELRLWAHHRSFGRP